MIAGDSPKSKVTGVYVSVLTRLWFIYCAALVACSAAQAQDSLGPALNQLFESAKTTKPGSASRQQADENFQSVGGTSKRASTPQLGGATRVSPEPEVVEIVSKDKTRLIEFSGKKKK